MSETNDAEFRIDDCERDPYPPYRYPVRNRDRGLVPEIPTRRARAFVCEYPFQLNAIFYSCYKIYGFKKRSETTIIVISVQGGRSRGAARLPLGPVTTPPLGIKGVHKGTAVNVNIKSIKGSYTQERTVHVVLLALCLLLCPQGSLPLGACPPADTKTLKRLLTVIHYGLQRNSRRET